MSEYYTPFKSPWSCYIQIFVRKSEKKPKKRKLFTDENIWLEDY